MFFEGFKRNGLQIRIQREKLRISAPDDFLTFFEKVTNFQVYNVKKLHFNVNNHNFSKNSENQF